MLTRRLFLLAALALAAAPAAAHPGAHRHLHGKGRRRRETVAEDNAENAELLEGSEYEVDVDADEASD